MTTIRTQTIRAQIEAIAQELLPLSGNISVRDDENGAFILAFGLKDVHSLELRRIANHFEVQLWHGARAEDEYVEDRPTFETAQEALACAKAWLGRDAI